MQKQTQLVLSIFLLSIFSINLSALNTYIITGAPGTGKTSLIEALKAKGEQTFPEIATMLIEKALERGEPNPATNDPYNFHRQIVQVHLENIKKATKDLPSNGRMFLDRGLPDVGAYAKIYGLKAPEELKKAVKEHHYDAVFFLNFIVNEDGGVVHRNTDVREENLPFALKIDELLKQEYKQLGYEVITVPSMSVEKRAKFVLETIKDITVKQSSN
ncbi:ATP-binding protein [Candidatus Babeliales bacterium]|nr:ATP-binding protein [Candidatus Babeliales bacterium]